MTLLGLVFLAGLAGSGHCLGMCGPLVLAVGTGSGSWPAALGRQIAYTLGRAFTYAVLGMVGGYGGAWLIARWPSLPQVAAVLAIAAGLVLLQQGLKAAGLWPWHGRTGQEVACMAGSFLAPLMRKEGLMGAGLAGLFTGLLPCGLLYGMVALAASSHSPLWGALTMAVFALGNAPALILAGLSGRLLTWTARRRLFAVAAWCLMLTGVISVARGVAYLQPVSGTGPASTACPMCGQ